MTALTGPVCDAGRCAQLVKGLAEARNRMVETQGEQLAAVLRFVAEDPELELDDRQRKAWPAVVVRAMERLSGGQPVIEGRVA